MPLLFAALKLEPCYLGTAKSRLAAACEGWMGLFLADLKISDGGRPMGARF